LEVRGVDGPLALGGAKQRALLALLLLNANRVVSRERLIDALWGEDPPETAVTTVQVYVSRLRKVIGVHALITRAPGYLLVVDPESIDLSRFERLLAQGREALAGGDAERSARALREALALWRGPALAEFEEAFARLEARRLEDLHLAAIEDRIEADLARGRHGDVIGELELLIAEHPHRERLRELSMLALYRTGRQAEALEAYRSARGDLDELGIEPGERLRSLERAILGQDRTLAAPRQLAPERPPLPPPLALRGTSPFVGRTRELATLRSLLELVEAGEGGRVALLGGDAGTGKTRLVRELAHEAVGHGTLVLYGAAEATVNAPYQPFVEALEFLLRVTDRSTLDECLGDACGELAWLLPDLGPSPANLGNPADARRRLHAAVARFLVRVGTRRPLLLVVDDAHWADVASHQLLRDLARTAPEGRVLLLTTHREHTEDVRPELTDTLAALTRLEGLTRLTIGGLGDDDVAEFIRRSEVASVGDDVSALAGTMCALTDGVPFLLTELWRALVDEEAVDSADGRLQLARASGELASPQGVRDVVRYRLSRLAPATTELLELAAVTGSTFELRLIEQALGNGSPVASLEEALGTGTIEELPGPTVSYRFAHELVRRALYDRFSTLRRAELHLRVGEALELIHDGAPDAVLPELAHHFAIAAPVAGAERAVKYNVQAAEAALALFAFADAEALAVTALGLASQDEGAWARAQLLLATAEMNLGESRADATAAAAVAAFRALGDVEGATQAELVVGTALLYKGRGDDAVGAHERVLALARDLPASRAKAEALAGSAFIMVISQGRFREAVDVAADCLALSEELALVPFQASALATMGAGHHFLDEAEQAERELTRAIELGRGGVNPDATSWACMALGFEMYSRGRVREAGRWYAAMRDESERFGVLANAQVAVPLQASAAYVVGDWGFAEERLEEYGRTTAAFGGHVSESLANVMRSHIARARGDHALALALAEQSLRHAREAKYLNGVGRGLKTVAMLLVDEGRLTEAAVLLDELLAIMATSPPALWWRCLVSIGWLTHDLGRLDPPPVSARRAWSDPAQAISRGDFARAAKLFAATELHSEEAYVRLRLAEQLAGEGRAEAQLHAERARAFYGSVRATAYLRRAEALIPAPT
jgi:DNA-binding SARP family transcriptional activator